MSREGLFDRIGKRSTLELPTFEQVVESECSSHHTESMISCPSDADYSMACNVYRVTRSKVVKDVGETGPQFVEPSCDKGTVNVINSRLRSRRRLVSETSMRAGETFVVSLNDSLNMSSTLSQVEAEKNAAKSKGRNLKPQRGRRKLRSRRNLVDSADATNNATFEISVAPLIDTRNEKESVSGVASRGANRRAIKKLRSRRNLVDSLSAAAAANITFELSVAQLSERKNEALAAASTEEASSMGALKCTAESPPLDSEAVARALEGTEAEDEAEGLGTALSHEESLNLTKNQDSSKGGRRSSLSQSMAENFVHVENDDATMEISVAPLPAGLNEGQIEVLETVNVSHLQAEIFPDAEVVEMVVGGAEASALEHVDAPRLAEINYSNGRTDSVGANLSDVEVDSVPVIGIEASDTVVSTPSPEPSPVGDASMAISMSEVSGASVTVAVIQTPAIMPSVRAIPTDFSTMEAFTAAEAPPNSAVSRDEQENGDVTRHPVEHQPEALLLCEDVSMVVSNLEVSVTDEPNPPPALKEIDDEVASMIVKSNISGVGADTQFIEDEPTEEKVISMVVSQMDVSASVVDSVVSMVAKEAPKRKVTYAGRWATNNVDDSMLRIDFAKDSTRTREVAPHDQVLPTAGLLSEPKANVQIIEAQDPRAFRAVCADVADSSVMVSRPEAPATDERSSSGEVNAGNACPEEAADVRSQVGAPTDSNWPHPAAESERSDTGGGGDGEVEVASLAISKSIVPDVVVVGQAAEFAPAPEAVVNVSSQTQAEDATLLEEKLQNQPKVQGKAVPDTNFTGSRSSSDSPGKKRSLRFRRLLVNSVDAVDDNVTMEISVASLAGKRSDEGREGEGDDASARESEPSRVEEAVVDASSQAEVEDMAVDEQAAESTPAAEDVANVPSETQTEDASLLQEQSVNQSKVQGISTESKSNSDSPGDKGVLRSRCMSVDSVAAVNDNVTMAITVASLADKGNDERREGKGDDASARESEPSRVEEAVVDASSQAEVEGVVAVGQPAESAPTAEEMSHVSSQTQAEGVSVASRSSSASRVKKRSLRSRRMLVNSVDAVKDNVTVEISVTSPTGKRSGERMEGEGNGASAREAELPQVEEAVADASSQTGVVKDLGVDGQVAEFTPAAEGVISVPSEAQTEDTSLSKEKLRNQSNVQGLPFDYVGVSAASKSSSDSQVNKRSLRSRRMLVNSVNAVEDNITTEISVASLEGKQDDVQRQCEGDDVSAHEAEPSRVEEAVADASSQTEVIEDVVVDGQPDESAPAAEAVVNYSRETKGGDASLLQEQSVNQSKVQGISTESKSNSDSPGDKGVLRSRCMSVDSVAAVNDSATMAITVASPAGRQNDQQKQGESDNASAHEAEPSRMEEAVVDASCQAEAEDVVVVGQPAESAPTAEEMSHVSSQTQAEGVSVASRSSSASRVKKRSLRSRRMLVNSVDAVKDNVTVEISVASLEGKESDGQRQREGNGASARETEPPRVEEVVADASSQTEVVKDSSKRCRSSSDSRISGINLPRFSHQSVAETPSTKVTTNASNQTDTPAPDIEMTGQADSGKVNFKRASRPVYSRKVRKILLDESVLETPQPVSPRCVWPSPLRRSGSLGYTCPSLSAVPLVETKSKNTSSSCVLKPTGASSGTFRSLAGSQCRTITHQEIREIEEKLLDTSADVVEDQPNPQITMSNGTTLTREKESAKSAPPVTVPNDLSLSASCLDRTILQDMVLMPPPLPLKHRHGAFTGETRAAVAATAASPSFSAPTSSVATGRRRSVQFAPLAEVLRQSPHGQWSRLSVGLTDQLDLSPIPKSREGVDEVDSSTDDSGDSSDLSCSPVEENDEAEPRDTVSPISSSLNRSNVSCHLSPTAVEVLNRWREDQSILVEAEEEKITEKTYIESLLPGGESLTPEQMKHVLGCLQPSEPSPDATPCSSHPNVRSKLNEKTCEIDPSMTSLSQWLPPPSEGKVYDMDAVGNALRLMLMGWVEPQDPVFIPLPKSAYQHHVNAGPGLRRSTRIRVAPPRDSYERVYYDVRPNPTTGRLERIPLGYLRYPNQKEVRRRQQLLKNRLQIDDKDTAAVRKRARDARLHRLAAKRRRVLGLSDASHHFGRSRVIVLESDVTWVKDGTNSLPIGQLINSKGPSNLPVVFDSLNEAQSHLKGGVIQSLTECEIEPGSGLSHVGPLEQSLHDITNVISVEQKRRGLHFDAKASNLFTLRLQNPDELTSKNPLLAVQIGTYAIPLRKACCVLVPKGIPYKFISIAPNVIRLSRLRFIPP